MASPYCLENYRIICEEYVHANPLLTVFRVGIIGFRLGMACGRILGAVATTAMPQSL